MDRFIHTCTLCIFYIYTGNMYHGLHSRRAPNAKPAPCPWRQLQLLRQNFDKEVQESRERFYLGVELNSGAHIYGYIYTYTSYLSMPISTCVFISYIHIHMPLHSCFFQSWMLQGSSQDSLLEKLLEGCFWGSLLAPYLSYSQCYGLGGPYLGWA